MIFGRDQKEMTVERQHRGVRYDVERVEIHGPVMSIFGWAFLEDRPTDQIRIHSKNSWGSDSVPAVAGQPRPDIFRRLGLQNAKLCGFAASGLLVDAESELYIDLFDDSSSETTVFFGWIRIGHDGRLQFESFIAPAFANSTVTSTSAPHVLDLNYEAKSYIAQVLPRQRSEPLYDVDLDDITIMTSIYQGREFLDDFFGTFLENTSRYGEFVIVDNGNTDPELSDFIGYWAERLKNASVVRVQQNQGYIEGICEGFNNRKLSGHVVVLNTDLMLPPRWLERLARPLRYFDNLATITPLTNAGTSCSFPIIGVDNPLLLGRDLAEIDTVFENLDSISNITDIPSGVGFCMLLNGRLIEEMGFFERKTFGLGYGEENDWSLKAYKRGWRNILYPGLFVYHKHGGIYPSDQKQELIQRNLKIIADRYPFYDEMVHGYFSDDPLFSLRTLVSWIVATGGVEEDRITRCDMTQLGALLRSWRGEPRVVLLEDAPKETWGALLLSSEVRGFVWGWGINERNGFLSFVVGSPTTEIVNHSDQSSVKSVKSPETP